MFRIGYEFNFVLNMQMVEIGNDIGNRSFVKIAVWVFKGIKVGVQVRSNSRFRRINPPYLSSSS